MTTGRINQITFPSNWIKKHISCVKYHQQKLGSAIVSVMSKLYLEFFSRRLTFTSVPLYVFIPPLNFHIARTSNLTSKKKNESWNDPKAIWKFLGATTIINQTLI